LEAVAAANTSRVYGIDSQVVNIVFASIDCKKLEQNQSKQIHA
jgi:hypothetical protein